MRGRVHVMGYGAVVVCAVLAGCGSERGLDPFATGAPGSVSGDTGPTTGDAEGEPTTTALEGSSEPTASEAGDAADGSGPGVKLDVGAQDAGDQGVPGGDGCNAVDLLFVIDNSGSMQPYQAALAQTFPAFVDAIFASLPVGTDLHVAITNTSFGSPQAGGVGSGGCSNAQHDAEALADHYPPPSAPNGQNGGQGRLYVHDGLAYFATSTGDDPAALAAWFTGAAAAIGEQGSNWEMVSAGAAFVAHPDNAAANAGFIRDAGAVLVVFVLTDEFDNSPEEAASYHDLVVAAKAACGGDMCVVPAGLVPPCVEVTPANVLHEFLHAFGNEPVLGDIGEPEDTAHYPSILGDALAQIVAETCEQIRPEG